MYTKDNGYRSWIDELPGIVRKCIGLATELEDEEEWLAGEIKVMRRVYMADAFDIEVWNTGSLFKLNINPGTIPLEPLENDIDPGNPLLSITMRPYPWWVSELSRLAEVKAEVEKAKAEDLLPGNQKGARVEAAVSTPV
jgi:hypothetical protein